MNNINGMKHCLKLIEELRNKYNAQGFEGHDLSIDRVLKDVENEIGVKVYKKWEFR